MSEQFKQEAGSQGLEIEDDPLAELARIVAGEPELNPTAQAPAVEEDAKPEASLEAAVEEATMSEVSIEAALEEQLIEFSSQDELAAQVEAPSFVEDINSSIEQISNAEIENVEVHGEQFSPELIVEETFEPEPPVEAMMADPEVGFQNGLIDALEVEIGGGPEPVLEPEPIEEVHEVALETEPAYVPQDAATEIEYQESSMQETLEQELAGQYESVEPTIEEPAPLVDEPIASIEADLGDAFASEFEQISAQQPQNIEESYIAQASPDYVQEPEQLVVEGDANIEMDFESAFEKELEGVGVAETHGWAESETADANAAFTAAVSSEVTEFHQGDAGIDLDQMEHDPGHVGSVDEISAIDAGGVVANDNGGGKKYAIAALVIALFAGVIAAGYGFLGGENSTVASSTPEIIKASNEPVKVKPEDPGGVVPENQDNASYGDLGGENTAQVSQETLNSQTEEPLVLNTGNSEAPKSDDRLISSEDTGATPNTTNSAVLPKVVQTVVVKPDGTIITKPALPKIEAQKPIETALNTVTIGDTANVAIKPVATQVIKKPEAIDGAKSTGDVSIPVASPLPKPIVQPKAVPVKKVAAVAKPKKVASPPTRKSEWVVQVSSQRSPEAAQSSFVNMRNKYSALKGRAMSIQRANVNGATYYRVRVQTVSKDDANQLCTSLATAGGSCFVTR